MWRRCAQVSSPMTAHGRGAFLLLLGALSCAQPPAAPGSAFGPGCAASPSGAADPASFAAMAHLPVATALAQAPVAASWSTAVAREGLVAELDAAPALTLLVPVDPQPPGRVGMPALVERLSRHTIQSLVIPQRLSPERLPGCHPTLAGEDRCVRGLADVQEVPPQDRPPATGVQLWVEGFAVQVVCANIQTANATVYLLEALPADR